MKKKTRIVSFVLALLLVMLLCPAAFAANDFTVDNGVLIKYNGSGGAVTIPDGVTVIGVSAFEGCSSLTSIIIPNSVTRISTSAFDGCSGLTSIIIPDSVKVVGFRAFGQCKNLTSISISSSVTEFDNTALNGCFDLLNINVDPLNKHYASVDGVLYNKDRTVLVKCPNGKTGAFAIPNSVKEIGRSALSSCSGLTSITIPNSVTVIGDFAFHSILTLTSIVIPYSVTVIGYAAFAYCSGLTNITIPNSVTVIGESAFHSCGGLTNITIPSSVTVIGERALTLCKRLESIDVDPANTNYMSVDGILYSKDESVLIACPAGKSGAVSIPNSVTLIAGNAFEDCDKITSITIPDIVKSIGNSAFSRCSKLMEVNIPNSVTHIGDMAFAQCFGLRSVTIPSSVSSIGDLAFTDCDVLTEINVDPSNESFASVGGVMYSKDKTVLLAYPAGKKGAFSIPKNVTVIGANAFAHCIKLTSITIPDSVTEIGVEAFYSCFGLRNISIPNSVIAIRDGAFYNCVRLTSVIIPDSVKSIGTNALSSCHSDFTIYGISGSYAEFFAKNAAIRFSEGTPPNYPDSASEWARAEIMYAIAMGFVPDNIQDDYAKVITRQEFCRLAVRFVEYALDKDIEEILIERGLSRSPGSFTDTTDPYIMAAYALGITNGTKAPTDTAPGLFSPNGQFSRQEAATMLMRVCWVIGMDSDGLPPADFVDLDAAESWARNGISFVRAKGIMGGTSASIPTFNPRGTYTRQESIVTFSRISS